ncbi:MAG: caspase family protein [Isosphaeraceae bacterium]|nr:caspase family protein [Isosphaeraceae bacterium]
MRPVAIVRFAVASLLVLACGHVALGQGAAARRWAVVIGVEKYSDPAISRLRFCAADAKLVAETLVKSCGYDARDVLVMTDDQKDAALRPVRTTLADQIPKWLAKAEPGDTVLIYFSGHGFLDDRGQGYLAPQDCRRDNLGLSALRTDELRNQLAQCKATQKMLVLDCCHAGGARGEADGAPSGQEVGSAFREAQGLVTMASCRKAEQSHEWDERGHGLFSFYLADGLGGAADRDGDGIVDSDELYHYVFDQVTTAARKELNVRQTPVRLVGDDATGVFALSRVTPRVRGKAMNGVKPPVAVEDVPAPRIRFEYLGALAGNSSGPAVFSPDGSLIATQGIRLWDPKTREEVAILKSSNKVNGNQEIASVVGFSRDGKKLIANGGMFTTDKFFELWDVAAEKSLLLRGYVDDRGQDQYNHPCFAADGRVAYIRMFYDRARTDTRYYLMLWDMDTGKETVLRSAPALAQVRALAAAPDGKTLALGDDQGNIVLFDPATRTARTSFSAHGSSIQALFYAPKGDLLASNSFDDTTLRLWDAATGRKVGVLKMDREGIYQKVVFHPSAPILATSCGPIYNATTQRMKPLTFWDLRTRKPLEIEELDAFDPLAFSPDGTVFAAMAVGPPTTIGLWRVHLHAE